jgi:hypothetical protein
MFRRTRGSLATTIPSREENRPEASRTLFRIRVCQKSGLGVQGFSKLTKENKIIIRKSRIQAVKLYITFNQPFLPELWLMSKKETRHKQKKKNKREKREKKKMEGVSLKSWGEKERETRRDAKKTDPF